MSSDHSTSIGRGPAHGGNENHDGDPRNRTLGEKAPPDEPPVGNPAADADAGDASTQSPDGKPVERFPPA